MSTSQLDHLSLHAEYADCLCEPPFSVYIAEHRYKAPSEAFGWQFWKGTQCVQWKHQCFSLRPLILTLPSWQHWEGTLPLRVSIFLQTCQSCRLPLPKVCCLCRWSQHELPKASVSLTRDSVNLTQAYNLASNQSTKGLFTALLLPQIFHFMGFN